MTKILLPAGLLAVLGASAWCTPLAPPSSFVTCTSATQVQDPSGCVNGGAFASLTLFPFVNETVQASVAPGPQNGAGALANITYSFQVLGGTPGGSVPIIIAANLGATATSISHALGFASVSVQTSQGFSQVCVDTAGACGGQTQFSGTFASGVLSGELGDTVVIESEANAGGSPVSESASAFADPLIFVDPTFPGADQFTIVVSPGVGNALPSAVPEPGSLILSGGAVLMLVALGLRRRNNSYVPPAR